MSDPSFAAPHDPRPAHRPRFSAGRRGLGGGLVACLWLWTSAGPIASAAALENGPSVYGQALDSFHRRNYEHALSLLEHLPNDASARQRADVLNLRGAIYLRQRRFDQARSTFAEATRVDPDLWAAKFNGAEVAFRQKNYAESRQQFDRLLDRTSRIFHPEEHRFVDYKARLAALCAGNEQPALEFIAEHRTDSQAPQAWYYLNSALEQRHGRPQKAEEWLAQADSKVLAGGNAAYAESFKRLGWPGEESSSGHDAMAANRRTPDASAVAEADKSAVRTSPHRGPEFSDHPARTSPPATVAMVQLLPERREAAVPGNVGSPFNPPAPVSRDNAPAGISGFDSSTPPTPGDRLSIADLPPGAPEIFADSDGLTALPGRQTPLASVLAKPRRGKGTPAPAPTPSPGAAASPGEPAGDRAGATSPAASPSPDASAAGSAAASPTAAPGPSASLEATPAAANAEYTQKYEAAYVKFLEKDYPATLALLDEANAIQPKQPQTATLRAQVFKQEYEAAYLAYRRSDFTTALALLDQADAAQPNYPDALNLRGLVFSKQRVYDRAEAMFKKAIQVDPTLWAAKFNFAELPFNRGDYTTARSRFEDLLAETDAAKRPREAELTQYKVFLTLLLEGKTDQARSFMDHFNFSGTTPAKYFCNAAMNFRAGTVDKANDWINSAKREYPASLVSIFTEPFYRLGWLADPTAPGTAVATATTSPATETTAPDTGSVPAVSPKPTAAMVAAASATPSPVAAGSPVVVAAPSPMASVAATAAPIIVALASPVPSPVPVLPSPVASASPTATRAVAVASVTPVPTPKVTPAPTATATATPTATAAATVTPTPTAPVRVAPAAASVTPAATTEPPSSPAATQTTKPKSGNDDVLRLGIVGAFLFYGLYVIYQMATAISRKKARIARRRAKRLAAKQSEEVETPR